MPVIDIAALKALATECTHSDGWNDEWVGRIARDTGLVTREDARFIAACKPATILALIAQMELVGGTPQPVATTRMARHDRRPKALSAYRTAKVGGPNG